MAEIVKGIYRERGKNPKREKIKTLHYRMLFSSEYLSYINVVTRLLKEYENIEIIDAAVTAETVPQTMAHIYNRVVRYKPDICSHVYGHQRHAQKQRRLYEEQCQSKRVLQRYELFD